MKNLSIIITFMVIILSACTPKVADKDTTKSVATDVEVSEEVSGLSKDATGTDAGTDVLLPEEVSNTEE